MKIFSANLAGLATVYLKVAAANPSGTKAIGSYTVSGGVHTGSVTAYTSAVASTISTATPIQYSAMTVGEARLVRFSLNAVVSTGSPATAVGVTIFDSLGKAVYSFSDVAGGTMTTGSVWLIKGTYTIAITAKTSTGATPTSAAFTLNLRELGDPLDPVPDDPNAPPPVVTSPPVTTPPLPVNDPIPDPWAPNP